MNTKQQKNYLKSEYNLTLDLSDTKGEKTYWDLYEYFKNEIEEDHILISTDCCTGCCQKTDIDCMKEEFDEKIKEIIENENSVGNCTDTWWGEDREHCPYKKKR